MESEQIVNAVAEERVYWFRAKTYGWGWVPATWQGWGVTLVYLVLVTYAVVTLRFPPDTSVFLALRVILARILAPTLVLLFICWKKGEPPRFRWGNHEKE